MAKDNSTRPYDIVLFGATGFTGGLAADVGLVNAMRESATGHKMAVDVRSHPDSILAGALGAALWGAFRARKLRTRMAS